MATLLLFVLRSFKERDWAGFCKAPHILFLFSAVHVFNGICIVVFPLPSGGQLAGRFQCSYDIKFVVGVEDGVARILEDFSYIPDIGTYDHFVKRKARGILAEFRISFRWMNITSEAAM